MKKKTLLLTLFCTLALAVSASAYDPVDQEAIEDEYYGGFMDYIRNDGTGKWRLFRYSDVTAPADDFAERYYRAFFESDDEIHFVINFGTMETTRITYASGYLFVTTFNYVDNEEHDAKMMPAGDMLRENILEIEANDYEAQKAAAEEAARAAEEAEQKAKEEEERAREAEREARRQEREAEREAKRKEKEAKKEAERAEKEMLKSEETIMAAQEALTDLGYYDGDIDGDDRYRYRRALEKYQEDNGLWGSGRMDRETYDLLLGEGK